MRTLGNIVWALSGGLLSALGWIIAGIVMYITIIGIPLGRQAFKMAEISFTPFGREVYYGGGAPSFIANVFWVVLIGFWQAAAYAIVGGLLCLTIVGIPFGLQFFKLAKLFLAPFGAQVCHA